MKRLHVSLLTMFLTAACGAASAADWSVELTVHESASIDRKAEPVSGGVPLPMGLVKRPADVHLTDANGREVPGQFSAINRWGHDGSVMWLLVQATATVPAKGKVSFFLKPGAAKVKRGLLQVIESPDAVVLKTGADGMELRIDKKKPRVPEVRLVLKNGEVYSSAAAPPEKVVVEERGPERATVVISGRHMPEKKGASLPYCYGYIFRIRLYAGRTSARLTYTITNDAYPPIGSPVCKQGALSVRWQAPCTIAALGGAGTAVTAPKPAGPVRLFCPGIRQAQITGMGRSARLDWQKLGWAGVGAGDVGGWMGVRYLNQNHPASLVVRPGEGSEAIEFEFWPPEAGDANYLEPCARKTYELLLAQGHRDEVISNGGKLFAAFHSPLRFWCKPEWVTTTKAWGDFGSVAVPDDAMKTWIARRFRPFRSTGWRHHGSTPSMESGSSRAPSGGYEPIITDGHFYLGYMLTGDRRYFDQLERTSWHWRDRHYIHLQKDISKGRWAGRGGVYCKYAMKGGADFPKVQLPNYRRLFNFRWNYGGRWGPMDTQHFSVDEVVNYYYLTGDRSCLTAINKYGEQAASFVNAFLARGKRKVSREHGWVTRALVSAYEATNEKRWLDLARKAVHAIVAAQDKRVGTIYDVKQQQVPFMAAAVGMALGRYYRHHPEEDVRDAILGIADWLAYDVAIPGGGFAYRWDWDKPSRRSASGNRCMSTMGWAYLATGQKRYMDAADAHAQVKRLGQDRALRNWLLSGFGQEYVTLKMSPRADGTPPAAVKDLVASQIPLMKFKASGRRLLPDGRYVLLIWTAPGDDGYDGAAAEYQVAYATKEIKERSDWRAKADTEISFWAATNCKDEPKPSKGRTRETFIAEVPGPGTYWFALKTYDEQPNQSDLSNVVKVQVK